jgi:hypothetical protein
MNQNDQDPRIQKFLQYELATLKNKLDMLEKNIENDTLDHFFGVYFCYHNSINYYLPVILATTTYFYSFYSL